ncbi:MAG: Ig-like domain-containing protein [Christensenellales bacterium]
MKTKKAVFLALALLVVLAALPWQGALAAGTRYYVKQGGDDSKDGLSWENAKANLKNVMDAAKSGDEIWVAAGTYGPGTGVTDTFHLKRGVKVYGGFAGNEGSPNERDLSNAANKTTLDGGGNVYHVVTGGLNATPANTRLDGFTITGGNANGSNDDALGGGMYNGYSSPTVSNCVFSGNTANDSGGGMFNSNSSPAVENCVFSVNTAVGYGGGMFNVNSSPTVENCAFTGNTANDDGGGMFNSKSSPAVSNCVFSGNTANDGGGGMFNVNSSPTVENCAFTGNTANDDGGGMSNDNSSPAVKNCAFSGNTATSRGGGMHNSYSSPAVVNCTFSGNQATDALLGMGGGMCNHYSSPAVVNCTFSKNTATFLGGGMYSYNNSSPILANTILWGNTAPSNNGPDIYQSGGTLTLTNCVVGQCTLSNEATKDETNPISTDPNLQPLDKDGNEVTNPEAPENRAKVYIYGLGNNIAKNAGLNVDTDVGNGITVPETDQRGVPRRTGDNDVDIGAYEDEAHYTVAFDANSGTGYMRDCKILAGQEFTFPPNGFEPPTGKEFDIWAIGNINSNDKAAPGEKRTFATGSTTTVYALWKNKNYTITVKSGTSIPPGSAAYGKPITIMANAAPSGQQFQNWTVNSGGAILANASNATTTFTMPDSNVVITANFGDIPVTGVTVSPATLLLRAGGATGTLTATVQPDSATDKTVTWTSGNESVATVAGGVVTPVAAGETTITATTSNGKTAECAVTVRAASNNIWYVTQTGANKKDGTSWLNASPDLKGILAIAQPTDQVWVAKGTYSPGNSGADTFLLKAGVFVYGGFEGNETSLNQRVLSDSNKTTLDGGGTNWHVVTGGAGALNTDTCLDGFTITRGNANGSGDDKFGGGMYNNASSPAVANCAFSDNTATTGGGMFNINASPKVENCVFSNNTVGGVGGGMYNNNASPAVTNCDFSGNKANAGGGMYNQNSSPTLKSCTFSDNTARGGGGMHNVNSSPTLTSCTFSDNTASVIGGGMNNDNASPKLTDCKFTDNTATKNGGGMYNDNSSPTLESCTFTGNKATDATDGNGGGMYNDNSSPTLTSCTFSDNTASVSGGGMDNDSSSPEVENCVFSTNTANYGGGMYNVNNSSPKVTGCIFSGNTANDSGGGMRNVTNSHPTVMNCSFSGNTAFMAGGMDNVDDVHPMVINCTFSGNTATNRGGGMMNMDDGNPTVVNCTFSGNTAIYGGGMDIQGNTTSPTVVNTILWGNTAGSDDIGPDIYQSGNSITLKNCVVGKYKLDNGATISETPITADPKLQPLDKNGNVVANPVTNPTQVYIYKLGSGSSAIDAGLGVGTHNGVTVPDTDQRGVPRPNNAVDIGAYEDEAYFTIIFISNGGSGQMKAGKAIANVPFKFPANGFTPPTGKEFDTWAIGSVNGTQKNPGDTHPFSANENVFALWKTPVTGVSLNKTTLTLLVGNSETLTATVAPENATHKDVTWSSDDETVATVDNSGKVTAVAPGTATITVKTTDGEKTATCTVTVNAATVAVTGVSLNKTATSLVVGGTEALQATIEPATATNQNVTWSSDKPAIATVDNGVVTAISVGQATITVKTDDGNKTATCTVTVSAAGAQYTTVLGNNQTYTRGSGLPLELTIKRNTEDQKTFGRFRHLLKDGALVPENHYTKKEGSLIVRLKSAWLDTLSAGLHALRFVFEDGEAQASFTVQAKPGSFEDVAVPGDHFTFTKRWQGGTGKSIDWTLYDEMDYVAHKLFNKKVISPTEWRYDAWFSSPVCRYVVEKPVPGYKTRYENVGVYAGITDRCCNGGTIINYKIPKTGDEANLVLWAGLALLGVAGIGAVLMTGRRRKKGK